MVDVPITYTIISHLDHKCSNHVFRIHRTWFGLIFTRIHNILCRFQKTTIFNAILRRLSAILHQHSIEWCFWGIIGFQNIHDSHIFKLGCDFCSSPTKIWVEPPALFVLLGRGEFMMWKFHKMSITMMKIECLKVRMQLKSMVIIQWPHH